MFFEVIKSLFELTAVEFLFGLGSDGDICGYGNALRDGGKA
jgi:hypothetical protein